MLHDSAGGQVAPQDRSCPLLPAHLEVTEGLLHSPWCFGHASFPICTANTTVVKLDIKNNIWVRKVLKQVLTAQWLPLFLLAL